MKVEYGSTKLERGIEFLRKVKAVAPRRIAESLYYAAERDRVECLVDPTEEEFDFMGEVLLEHKVYADCESKLVVE